jgi:hypothetical protein
MPVPSRCGLVAVAVLAAPMVSFPFVVRAAQPGSAPFGIDQRPMPSGADLEKLVPMTVGSFKRPAFPAGTQAPSDQDLNVTYISGADSVFFGFSIPGDTKSAREAVRIARGEAGSDALKDGQYSDDTEPTYFRSGEFMAWTRGGYFFYANASSPAALEAFMKAFPY